MVSSSSRDKLRGPRKGRQLELDILRQPDGTTCGPTCLHAVYRFFGEQLPLEQVISEVSLLPGGGTLAVFLACHALKRGYRATIYTYNLQVFDPTWFRSRADKLPIRLAHKLASQARVKRNPKLTMATHSYLEFLRHGGRVEFHQLTPQFLRTFLKRGVPVLTGLSATYLYGCARERGDRYDDVRGDPSGHFVVLSGYDRASERVLVADPLHDNPRYRKQHYWVGIDRLLGAILLGILTYDANLLVIEPPRR